MEKKTRDVKSWEMYGNVVMTWGLDYVVMICVKSC